MDLQLLPGTNFLQYADDIVVDSSSKQVGEAVANLQSSFNMIYLSFEQRSGIITNQIQLDLIFQESVSLKKILSSSSSSIII